MTRGSGHALGRRAEQAAVEYLIHHGFTVLARNVRIGHLELDIVARKGSVVAVVEVRHRGPTSWETALESLGPIKRQRLVLAAERLWELRFAADPTVDRVRLDVACVSLGPTGPSVDYVEGGID